MGQGAGPLRCGVDARWLCCGWCRDPGRGAGAAPTPAPATGIALVIGNGAYRAAPLPTAANDAGPGRPDPAAGGLRRHRRPRPRRRRHLRARLPRLPRQGRRRRARTASPSSISPATRVQFDGDNYFVPVDATLRATPTSRSRRMRLSDFTRALAGHCRSRPASSCGRRLPRPRPQPETVAGGLALVDPEPGTLIAFNAAPGTRRAGRQAGPTAPTRQALRRDDASRAACRSTRCSPGCASGEHDDTRAPSCPGRLEADAALHVLRPGARCARRRQRRRSPSPR